MKVKTKRFEGHGTDEVAIADHAKDYKGASLNPRAAVICSGFVVNVSIE